MGVGSGGSTDASLYASLDPGDAVVAAAMAAASSSGSTASAAIMGSARALLLVIVSVAAHALCVLCASTAGLELHAGAPHARMLKPIELRKDDWRSKAARERSCERKEG